jgi:DNA-binding CsgD family transcriptional regulator
MLVEAQLRAGDRGAAEQTLTKVMREAAGSCGSWAHAAAARCHGLLGSDAGLDENFQTALAWHEHASMPFERARTELCYGERLRRARRRTDARQQLQRAATTFGSLGAELWLKRAESELAAAGARQSAGTHRSPWAQLTASETRVAQQIIDGATYAEAASALFISPRTIEAHLRQIYRKLSVRSSTELTRLLSRATDPVGSA